MLKHIFASSVFLLSLTAQAQTKNFIDQPYVEVSGNADSLITPDEIYITIRVSEKNLKDRVTLEETETKMYNSLKTLGINIGEDMQVKDMASNFKSYFLKSRDIIKSRTYILKVGNAQSAGRVFIELEKLDLSDSYISGVSHSDMENIRNRMLSKAMQNAKTKAESLTKPLNQSVGMAIHVADPLQVTTAGARSGNSVTYLDGIVIRGSLPELNQDKSTFTDIEFQKIPVMANISVKFAIQ